MPRNPKNPNETEENEENNFIFYLYIFYLLAISLRSNPILKIRILYINTHDKFHVH